MTTYEGCYDDDCGGISGFGKFMAGLLVVALLIGGFIFIESFVNGRSHAEEKHGTELDVSKCRAMFMNPGNYISLWKNFGNKKCAQLGEEEASKGARDWMERTKRWVIRIVDGTTGEEITMFICEGTMRCVENYLLNGGYINIR